jgi:hypothetical protein
MEYLEFMPNRQTSAGNVEHTLPISSKWKMQTMVECYETVDCKGLVPHAWGMKYGWRKLHGSPISLGEQIIEKFTAVLVRKTASPAAMKSWTWKSEAKSW